MKRFFRSLESLLFTGEQIKDYGVISEANADSGNTETSLLLCRRRGKYVLVLRHKAVAMLAFEVKYTIMSLRSIAVFKHIEADILSIVKGAKNG